MNKELEEAAEDELCVTAVKRLPITYQAFIDGAKFGAQWQQSQSGWVDKNAVLKILEDWRIMVSKNNSHLGEYAESALYNIIQQIEALPAPPVNR